ncbi:MAG: ThuA domain-containing protein [Fibrobacteria bacterium]
MTLSAVSGLAQMVTPDQCSPLKEKKVLVLPGNGHDGPRNATLTNLKNLATQLKFTIKADGNPLTLTDEVLNEYDIVVFNYFFQTQIASYFPKASKDAFMRWLKKGKKGYVGYHTSGANEWALNEWREYQDSVTGMQYELHPPGTPTGTVEKTKDAAVLASPIMKGLPATFTTSDEWYGYTKDSKIFKPEWNWKIMYYLASVGSPRSPGPPNHPAAWFREDALGTRFFYSIFIHTQDGANSDFFKSVLLRALEYVAGPTPASYPAPCNDPTPISSEGAARATQPGQPFVTTHKELRVELEGDYRLSIWSPSGKELFSLQGAGKKSYNPRPFQNSGLYVVKIETKARNYVQKIMIY